MARELSKQRKEKILTIARRLRKRYPRGKNAGMCIDASHALETPLKKARIPHKFVSGNFNKRYHCWVEIPNNGTTMVLDITADQFSFAFPQVLFDDIKNWPQYVRKS